MFTGAVVHSSFLQFNDWVAFLGDSAHSGLYLSNVSYIYNAPFVDLNTQTPDDPFSSSSPSLSLTILPSQFSLPPERG